MTTIEEVNEYDYQTRRTGQARSRAAHRFGRDGLGLTAVFMPGQLFTHYFLTDGIKATPEWQASLDQPEAFAAFRDGVARRHDTLSRSREPNEAATEQDLIRPVLELLGWADYLPQQGVARNEDIPDHLLFANADAKQRAAAERNAGDRFRYAAVVEEK